MSGVCSSTAQDVIRKRCLDEGSTLLVSGRDFTIRKRQPVNFSFKGLGVTLPVLRSGLPGEHQFQNAALALAGALLMRNYGYRIDAHSMEKGIQAARWPGRLEQLCSHPTVIADGAHNPQGWRALKKAISTCFQYKKQIFILGAMQDKAIDKMLKILTHDAYAIIVCRPRLERAADMEAFEKFISFSQKKRVFWIEKSTEAYSKALTLACDKDIICITGSLFLVGELREKILKKTGCSSGRIPL